jgi:hypothetical protein
MGLMATCKQASEFDTDLNDTAGSSRTVDRGGTQVEDIDDFQ